jgi:oxygen-independent coproporphyrinogen-3 oxidase
MELASLLAKYDRRIPRYTSYPTAPHFSEAVTSDTYAGWLADLPGAEAVSLYLHVPFCAALCLFCACHTTVARNPAPLIAYGETLSAEIDHVADAIGARRLPVRHVHWGGGTPTILPPPVMEAVMRRLRERFDILPDAEIAFEVDPRTLTPEAADTLARIGTTRASLGVQDFDPAVQQAINRHQGLGQTARCAETLRAVGIRSINLDLIYGLPRQTVSGVIETVERALTIAPDRAAVFGYAHVPWMKKHQSLLPENALPGAEERFAQRQAVEDTLTAAGYRAVGLDHFALPSDSLALAAAASALRRNFQGYTTDDAPTLLGFGASSIGALQAGYVQNLPSVPAWRDAVRNGSLPIARGVTLTGQDRLRRDVIEQVMCCMEVNLRAVAASHGAPLASLMDAAPALQELAADGLAEWDGSRLRMTAAGRPFVRAAAAAFDTYLRAGAARHSAAI